MTWTPTINSSYRNHSLAALHHNIRPLSAAHSTQTKCKVSTSKLIKPGKRRKCFDNYPLVLPKAVFGLSTSSAYFMCRNSSECYYGCCEVKAPFWDKTQRIYRWASTFLLTHVKKTIVKEERHAYKIQIWKWDRTDSFQVGKLAHCDCGWGEAHTVGRKLVKLCATVQQIWLAICMTDKEAAPDVQVCHRLTTGFREEFKTVQRICWKNWFQARVEVNRSQCN